MATNSTKENSFREPAKNQEPVAAKRTRLGNMGAKFRGAITRAGNMQTNFYPLVQRNIGFTLFLTLLGLIYIWNAHSAERKARTADKINKELRELKSEYMILNAKLSVQRKQTELAKMVDSLGLKPLTQPPYKLTIKK